ncbi:MAG: aromatic amino acid hydroxylase [Methylotenera sp.]|nr:aromatic amino acid hydroxylase [Oligoflexia bacterium]
MKPAVQLTAKLSVKLITETIPEYLLRYTCTQDPSLYTAMDHASWRYIMRVAKPFFKAHAHPKYLDGLVETGISEERIPLISEIDHCLRKFGWRAVPVSGFIPVAVFLEFQSLGILPIAADMRKIENLSYTPAPDIVHEAAGHAPILADSHYANYLRNYGEVARRAISSAQDIAVYEAIRNLSVVKEDPAATPAEVEAAQTQLNQAISAVDYVTESAYLSRMAWWSTEYGLIGSMNHPKIYGAGLLSSIGESYHCLSHRVRRIPFTADCINMNYDITRPQPNLFVASSFDELNRILEEFTKSMAFRLGGLEGLAKAKTSGTTTTTVLDTGIQISGTLADFHTTDSGVPFYLQFQGPTQLAFEDHEIDGQGVAHHAQGFGTAIGKMKTPTPKVGETGTLEFDSGVLVQGKLKGKVERAGRTVILSFEDCTVRLGEKILFQPDWGTYDLACGEKVISVFGGAADRTCFPDRLLGPMPEQKSNLTKENAGLVPLYLRVREIREAAQTVQLVTPPQKLELDRIHASLEVSFPEDWLLRMELLELDGTYAMGAGWKATILSRLKEIEKRSPTHAELIERGLKLI